MLQEIVVVRAPDGVLLHWENTENRVPEPALNPAFDDEYGRTVFDLLADEQLGRISVPRYFPPIDGPWVDNYPSSNFIIMTHPSGQVPRGDRNRVRQLQNLMHGVGSRDPIMGSDARFIDPHTDAQLDYGLESLPEDEYTDGGARVNQPPAHPQAQVGTWLGIQDELADLFDEDDPRHRKYGFHNDNLPPFVNLAGQDYPNTYTVLRIENIPTGQSYGDIMQFMEKYLIRRDKGINRNYPIHIYMDRSTGKSQDAWLEMPDTDTHDWALRQYERAIANRRPYKMGSRVVDIFSASQGEFMAAVFPHAKGIHWDKSTGIPIMLKLADIDPYSTAFDRFLSVEELYLVRMYIDNPVRAPFNKNTLPRCFESMITTLLKFPWYSPYFKVSERDDLFKTYELMLESLAAKVFDNVYVQAEGRYIGMTPKLCTNLVNVGLRCPGFSERQKYRISEIMQEHDNPIEMSQFSQFWPCQTLAIPAEVNDDDLNQWLAIFDKGATWTQLYPAVYGDSVGDIVELSKDRFDVWWMDDLNALAIDAGRSDTVGTTYADLADAEQILMAAILARGFKRFFAERKFDAKVVTPQPDSPVIKKKMEKLNVYKIGGADLPREVQPGDDIVYVAPKNRGTWRHLMTSNTSKIPPRSLTEVMAKIHIEADPEDELKFQRIQAEIRGEADRSESWTADDSEEGGVQLARAQGRDRRTYELVPAQVPPGTQGRSYSSVVSDLPQERTPQGRGVVLASRAAGTYSVPQRRRMSMASPDEGQQVDFGSIARRAVATKSRENTPAKVSSTNGHDPFGPSPRTGTRQANPERADRFSQSGSSLVRRRSQSPSKDDLFGPSPAQRRQASPERAGHMSQAGSSMIRRRSQSPAKYDPFGPSPAGAAAGTSRTGRTHESAPSTMRRRSQSPAKVNPYSSPAEDTPTGGFNRIGRFGESGSSVARRCRSKSPNKGNYDLTIRPPPWGGPSRGADHGPIGTPVRRESESSTVDSGSAFSGRRNTMGGSPVAAISTPTRRGTMASNGMAPSNLPEGDTVEDWPTPGHASRTGNRSRR